MSASCEIDDSRGAALQLYSCQLFCSCFHYVSPTCGGAAFPWIIRPWGVATASECYLYGFHLCRQHSRCNCPGPDAITSHQTFVCANCKATRARHHLLLTSSFLTTHQAGPIPSRRKYKCNKVTRLFIWSRANQRTFTRLLRRASGVKLSPLLMSLLQTFYDCL